MPLLVATAIGDTPDELYDRARHAAKSGADWIEIRLDGPSGLPWDLRGFFAFDKPCIATVRHEMDGGRSHADDATRAAILRRAVLAGAKAIDVEVWSDEARTLAQEARQHGARVIASLHDTRGTPSAPQIVATLREALALGADWAKVATTVTGPGDAAALVEAAQQARAEGLPYALMAVNDPFLRLLAPSLGMALVYGAIPGVPAAAPGQVPIPALRAAHQPAAAPGAITGATRVAFVLGHPVAHSKSPVMQNAAFAAARLDARYLALDVPPTNLGEVLRGLRSAGALGANLTVPHKETALALMDDLDASATAAGAVNTVVFERGVMKGHNTDGAGAVDALREAGVRLAGARTLILGAGGAARGVGRSLQEAGAAVTVTNRTPARAEQVAADLGFTTIPWERVPDVMHAVDLLVNATTVGLHEDAAPTSTARMLPGSAVFDCVYRPGGTELVRAAREQGLLAVPGERMLLHQGARAFTLWTGRPAPVEAMRSALEASL